jgi:hypothetical protein
MAGEPAPGSVDSHAFVGVGALSPIPAFTPSPINSVTSVLANLEPGLAVQAGFFVRPAHALELRISGGPNSAKETLLGGQVYGSFYIPRALGRRPLGAYVGWGIRTWRLGNSLTHVSRYNVAPAIAIGNRIRLGGDRFYLDIRVHEILGVYTWTSDAHTTGGVGTLGDRWFPKNPVVSFDVGVNIRSSDGRAPGQRGA